MEETSRSATLYDLAPGQSGVIRAVGNQSGAVKRRLIDMGLTPGTRVTVNKIAPLGDPLEVSLRGYVLSLRRADAAQIAMVEQTGDCAGCGGCAGGGPTAQAAMTKHLTDPGGTEAGDGRPRPRAGGPPQGLRPQRPRRPPHAGGPGGQPQLRQDHPVQRPDRL